MNNIRLFFKESLSNNLTGKLNKDQSHYLLKVMRIKKGDNFNLFNELFILSTQPYPQNIPSTIYIFFVEIENANVIDKINRTIFFIFFDSYGYCFWVMVEKK